MVSEISSVYGINAIRNDQSKSARATTLSSCAFPQQSLKSDQSHFTMDEFDDYLFAPILRTASFKCDDGIQVWYTPPVTEADVIGLAPGESKSLPLPTKELNLGNELSVSQSAPTSPLPSTSSSKPTRSKLKLNLPFKVKGFSANSKCFSIFGNAKKSTTSDSNISVDSSLYSVPLEPTVSMQQTYCNISVTETEVTEFASNLTSKLVHEVLNIDDSFESCDEIFLNPISHPECASAVLTPCDGLVVQACDGEVELVYEKLNESYSKPGDSVTHNFEEDCDVYFTGGSLDTIHGACSELTSFANAPAANNVSLVSPTFANAPAANNVSLVSPTATIGASESMASFSSSSTLTSNNSPGILKPPKRAEGYDPFGVHTDFETGMPKRVHFFDNIDSIETASVHMMSQESDSDDSTVSLEYAMRYCGLKSGLYDSSSSSSTESEGDFAPVRYP
jgi:hypothetical protein